MEGSVNISNEMMLFENEEFGKVRVVEVDGEIRFVAKDVAEALGYSRARDAVRVHCKGATIHSVLTEGGLQDMSVIT